MPKTTWTNLPSDRLTPKQKPQKQKPKQGKANNHSEHDIPKSKSVRELENLISKLSSNSTPMRDPKGGCFCLAHEHPLSPHVPACPSCALPLCALNLPYHLCPSQPCSQPLLTPLQTSTLLASLQLQLSQTLEKEERERQRLVDEAKRAEGAFPSLASGTTTPTRTGPGSASLPQLRPAHETGHKILSLTSSGSSLSGKQKIKIVSISRTPTPASSRPASGTSTPLHPTDDTPTEVRIPPPPTQVDYVRGKPDKDRPWKNHLIDDEVKYVPLPKQEESGMSRTQRRKANRKDREGGDGRENANVPGASGS
ncbi:hypothetical protein D9756_002831 [Leucocoprinus leucothites]|uniref:TRIP4/RQT4 C2HC5-type zinc finger domain-containing protein n=1 Tax=Leucocoprinus leucothites TaxID=201217 RepID=A0A8H5GC15_9AGAR|nr:hypothetical protein D9756_002831 [Leucoagaricus leucothites]